MLDLYTNQHTVEYTIFTLGLTILIIDKLHPGQPFSPFWSFQNDRGYGKHQCEGRQEDTHIELNRKNNWEMLMYIIVLARSSWPISR